MGRYFRQSSILANCQPASCVLFCRTYRGHGLASQTSGHLRFGETVRGGDVPGLCQGLPHSDSHGQIPQCVWPSRHLEGYVMHFACFSISFVFVALQRVCFCPHLRNTSGTDTSAFTFLSALTMTFILFLFRWSREGACCFLPQGRGVHEGVRGVGRRQADPFFHVHR